MTLDNKKEEGGGPPPKYEDLAKGERLADFALKLLDEERDAFIRKVMRDDQQDFAEA